jgi:hypothetical protein
MPAACSRPGSVAIRAAGPGEMATAPGKEETVLGAELERSGYDTIYQDALRMAAFLSTRR